MDECGLPRMNDQSLTVNAIHHGTGLTAYPDDEAMLRERLTGGRVDAESFRRPVARCEIASCRGMCCYDGVYLSPESAAVVEHAAVEHADFFEGLGLRLPDPIIVEGEWAWKKGGLKTAITPRTFSRTVQGFPPHFNDTACGFLTNEGLCSLQLLSQHLGRHPWYYKPVKCWMHPITLEGDESSVLTLHNDRTDPYRFPGYDGFVSKIFCGKTCPGGEPASAVLSDELDFLSRIVGRDLLAEARGKQ
jgi:hypothetical protein